VDATTTGGERVAATKSKKSVRAPKAKRKPAKAKKAKRPKARTAARPAAKKKSSPAKRKKASAKRAPVKKSKKVVAKPKSRVAAAKRRPKAKAPAKRTPAPSRKAIAAAPAKSAKPVVSSAAKPATKSVVISPARPPLPVAPASAPIVAKTPPRPVTKPLRIVSKKESAAPPRPVVPDTPIDIEAVRRRLRAKKDEILAMYLKDLKTGQESNDSPTEDIVDRANNAYSRELNFSISDSERAFLLQIDEALGRLDAGTYGKCAHCGDPIARPRLDAIPWARLCIRCQELFEQGLLAEA
jgi:DnaK suppressor protein